jgi:hypothetical protein
MTLEQALIIAVSSVTGALCYVCRLLWQRSEKCESDRAELHSRIQNLEKERGIAVGSLEAFERCPQPACPFRQATASP